MPSCEYLDETESVESARACAIPVQYDTYHVSIYYLVRTCTRVAGYIAHRRVLWYFGYTFRPPIPYHTRRIISYYIIVVRERDTKPGYNINSRVG